MVLTRRLLLMAAVLALSCLAGCAELDPGAVQQAAPAPAPVPFVRAEHACANLEPGRTDPAAVKKDLAALLTNVDGKLYVATNQGDFIVPSALAATEERVAVSGASFNYSDLMNLRLDYISPAKVPGAAGYPHGAQVWGVVGLYFTSEDKAKCVAQELFFVQGEQRRKYVDGEFAGFEPLAAAYRAEQVKPQVPEEQRRYIVQANSWAEQKNYAMALATYARVLQVSPVTYPAAYYNMALMHAQEKRPYEAIVAMKKYLLLVPEAPDARAAQDKIYEWEGIAGVR